MFRSTLFFCVVILGAGIFPTPFLSQQSDSRPYTIEVTVYVVYSRLKSEPVATAGTEWPTKEEADDKVASLKATATPNGEPVYYDVHVEEEMRTKTIYPSRSGRKSEPNAPTNLSGKTGNTPQVAARDRITVKVYMQVDGEWKEQPGLIYETTTDFRGASAYWQRWNAKPGWKATWNAPGWPRPLGEFVQLRKTDVPPYNPPMVYKKPEQPAPTANSSVSTPKQKVVGTWYSKKVEQWGTRETTWTLKPDGTAECLSEYTPNNRSTSTSRESYTWRISGSRIITEQGGKQIHEIETDRWLTIYSKK